MANAEKLMGAYRTAAKELEKVIEQADPRRPVAFLRRSVLTEIEEITEELDDITLNWLVEEIPVEYKVGSFKAIDDAKTRGLELTRTEFGQIHREAVAVLVEDAYLDFATGIEGVKRSGKEFLSELTKLKINERIVVGQIKGEGLYTIKREVKKLVENRGFTALIDRGGKRWKIDKYAEMLVRTHVIKANNAGIRNRLLENKVDLVEFSQHAKACPICLPHEGKTYSLTGKSKKHPAAPDIPIHPNCRHSYLPVVE